MRRTMRADGILKKGNIISLIAFICFVIALSLYQICSPKGTNMENKAKAEFLLIKHMPNSIAGEINNSHKSSQALVGQNFRCIGEVNYKMLREYYDTELIQKGWKFYKEEKVREWGKDYGGMAADYRKDECNLELFYPGEKANYSYTYAIDISIGLH